MLVLLFVLQIAAAASGRQQVAEGATSGTSSLTVAVEEAVCRSVDVREGSEGPADVYAVCGASRMRLGQADKYTSSYNALNGNLVVWLQSRSGSHVKLIWLGADGVMHVDDVSRELTKLSGRYYDAGLGDIVVDLSGFASAGRIAVPIIVAGKPSTKSAVLDLRVYPDTVVAQPRATPASN